MKCAFAGRPLILPLLCAASLAACGAEGTAPSDPLAPQFAKGGSGPRVDAAVPSYGEQGEQGKSVSILGSGFQAGDQASWERDGVPDPKVTVRSTEFVSSTELRATIDIAVDAAVAYYDIAVLGGNGRKGGIGTEKFEVTTANLLPPLDGEPATVAWGINDAAQIVGRAGTTAFFWSPGGGIEALGPMAQALDVDGAGGQAVGIADGFATLWTGGSSAWQSSRLPAGCLPSPASSGGARAITTDGTRAAGNVRYRVKNKETGEAVVWDLGSATCAILPPPASYGAASVTDMSDNGVVVGQVSGPSGARGAAWMDGVPTVLPIPAGSAGSLANGVNDTGTMVVGILDSGAVFWRRVGNAWSEPVSMPSEACQNNKAVSKAMDASDDGLVGGRGCDGRAWYWQVTGGTVVASGPLPGFGQHEIGNVEAVNNATGSGLPAMAGGARSDAVYWPRP